MTEIDPPIPEIEYVAWAEANNVASFAGAAELGYRQNVAYVLSTVQTHPYFVGLRAFLEECQAEYFVENNAQLFMTSASAELLSKTYASMVNKSYRQNVVINDNFPNPPQEGWLTPDNWFSQIYDIIRGRITCKYIDGPRFVAERLNSRAQGMELTSFYTSQQRDDGYYAYHFYVGIPVTMLDRARDVVTMNVNVELQVNTQLQDVLYNITHRYYEYLRNRRTDDTYAWKWDVNSSRFRVGYLSHTLHLLEAIILELRNSNIDIEGGDNAE